MSMPRIPQRLGTEGAIQPPHGFKGRRLMRCVNAVADIMSSTGHLTQNIDLQQEALSLIQDAVLGDIGLANTFPWAASGRRAVALPKDNVTFYTFPSEEPWLGWKTFPLEAYSSVQKWKEVVPAPGHIIGVVLETPT